MTSVTVSVVIPVRNGLPHLPRAVDSVMAELPESGELVIRDNRSDDGTAAWLSGLSDSRVRVISSETDDTAGENWTAVCREAAGEYVKLVCADDFIVAGGLRRQLDAADRTGAVMVGSRRTVVDAVDRTVLASHGLPGLVGARSGAAALARSVASGTNAFGEPAAVLIRRSALLAALPFTADYPYLTDLDLYTRVLAQGDFVGLPTVDAGFRVSAGSWSSEIGNEQLRQFRGWMRERIGDGSLHLSALQRVRAGAMVPAKFAARRLVNEVVSRRASPPPE